MDRLISLKSLAINKNMLPDLDYLLLVGAKHLKNLEATYNRLPVSYLDHLMEIIVTMPMLRTVSFLGNEMALNKYYRVKLASMAQLSHIDGMQVKDYARRELRVGLVLTA
jgi:hypothetical protein